MPLPQVIGHFEPPRSNSDLPTDCDLASAKAGRGPALCNAEPHDELGKPSAPDGQLGRQRADHRVVARLATPQAGQRARANP
jgi:hypothetical protein